MKKLLIAIIWLPLTLITIVLSFTFLNYRGLFIKQSLTKNLKRDYLAYTPFANVLGLEIRKKSAEEKAIENYLTAYGSPMKRSTEGLMDACKKYQVDPFLLVGIAMCESNLGKKSYKGCFNPFGLGIHSAGRLCFANWEESFFKMAKTIRKNYYDQGLNTIDQIMYVYCPNSLENGGSWARCVKRFTNEAREWQ